MRPGVNEVRGQHEDDHQTRRSGGYHPAALAAILRCEKPFFGISGRAGHRRGVSGGLPFAEDQQGGGTEDKDEKEQFIAHDGADYRHFRFAGRQPLRFAQFMQTRERQLENNQHQDHAGCGEETLQRHTQRALEENDSDGDGRGDSGDGADPGLQTLGGKLDGAQDQCQFGTLANDHEEDENEDAPAGGFARFGGIGFDFLLGFFFQVARNAIHPYDHRNNEGRGYQEQDTLEAIFTDLPAFQGDGHGQAENHSGGYAIPSEPS